MGKTNGRSDVGRSDAARSDVENSGLDLEHELPAADATDVASDPAASGVVSVPESELQRIKAERESLLDRLARMQAEFENVRRRNIKEQQDFRDFAAADTIKSLLPVLDSLERS